MYSWKGCGDPRCGKTIVIQEYSSISNKPFDELLYRQSFFSDWLSTDMSPSSDLQITRPCRAESKAVISFVASAYRSIADAESGSLEASALIMEQKYEMGSHES